MTILRQHLAHMRQQSRLPVAVADDRAMRREVTLSNQDATRAAIRGVVRFERVASAQ